MLTTSAGVYEEFDRKGLLAFCEKNDLTVQFTHLPGTFLLKGAPVLATERPIGSDLQDDLLKPIPLAKTESVEANFAFGFRQLTEIAMKALSPGINDPGTAMLSLRALFELFSFRPSSIHRTNYAMRKVVFASACGPGASNYSSKRPSMPSGTTATKTAPSAMSC